MTQVQPSFYFRPKVAPTTLPFSALGQGNRIKAELHCSFHAASSHSAQLDLPSALRPLPCRGLLAGG